MDRSKLIQNSLKKEIIAKNTKIAKLNYLLNNNDNEYLLEGVEIELRDEKKELQILITKLNEEILNDKKKKVNYKKSLNEMLKSLTDFSKLTKDDANLKKGVKDIHNIILLMEKYISR